MGVSYSIIPKSDVQKDKRWMEHIQSLKLFGKPDFHIIEKNSDFPTLNDVFEAIKNSKIIIEWESKELDEFQLIEGKREIVHKLGIKDGENKYADDFTMRYPESANKEYKIKTLLGIKSDIRILIKLFSSISKKCGSFFIVNPYEAYFVNEQMTFEETWKEIQQNWKE